MAQKDFKSCLTIAGQVAEYRFPAFAVTSIQEGDCHGLRFEEIIPLGCALTLFTEQVICSILNIGKTIFQGDLCIKKLKLAFPEPPYSEKYDIFLAESIEYNCDVTEFLVSKKFLDQPNIHADPVSAKTMLTHFQSMSPSSNKDNLFRRIKGILDSGDDEKVDQKYVAEQLCISPRTLRRKLSEELTSSA